jgi:hypothetical protein
MRHRQASLLLLAMLGASLTSPASEPPRCSGSRGEGISATRVDVRAFRSIKKGTSRDEVLRLVGQPSCLAGSGIAYDVYQVADGRQIWIAYGKGKTLWASIQSGSEGREKLF